MRLPLLLLNFIPFWTVLYTTPALLVGQSSGLDPQLVGVWIYTINASSGSGRTFVDKVTRIRWVFKADGSFERGASLEANVSREGASKSKNWSPPTENGTWYSEAGRIYLSAINGRSIPVDQQLSGSYYIEGNTMVFTGTDGKKAIWHR